MANIEYKSFPYDTQSQMEAYINTLHNDTKDGRLVTTFGDGCRHSLNGKPERITSNFMKHFQNYKYDNIFCTINLFNQFMHLDKPERNASNLYCIDTLVFDLDSISEGIAYSQVESQLIDVFMEFCKDKQFPVPNAFSYTGSGGVHLYYKIAPVYPRLNKAIRALKYIMADRIAEFLRNYEDSYGIEYKVDTQIFDDMRLDRVPGTMNPKTGRMCEFFKVENIERYTYKMLLGFGELDFEIDWDKLEKEAKTNFHYGKGKHTKIIISQFKKKEKTKRAGSRKGQSNTSFKPMMQRRINGLFVLAENGFDFKHCRESACFMLRQFCRWCGMKKEDELKKLHELNSKFWEPLDERSLLKQTDSDKLYKISDSSIAERLHLDVEDELFTFAFNSKNKPTVKEYGMNKRRLTRAKCFIAVAQHKQAHPEATTKEISKATGFTVDQVGRATAQLNRSASDCARWATTTLDEYEFINNYLDTHDKTHGGKDYHKKYKKTYNSKKILEKKVTIMGMMPEKIVISDDIINPPLTKDTVTHECEKLMGQIVMLKKGFGNIKSRDPLNWRIKGLYASCLRLLYVFISLEGVRGLAVACNFFVHDLNIPSYSAEHITRGYWKYSYNYIQTVSENQFRDGLVSECPLGHSTPMYNDEIKEFPIFEPDGTFLHSPEVIKNNIYLLKSEFDKTSLPEVPFTYNNYHKEYHRLKDSYKYQKDSYKNLINKWNVEEANRCVELAHEILNKLYITECKYYEETSIIQDMYPEYKGFDAISINKKLRRKFIEFSRYSAS